MGGCIAVTVLHGNPLPVSSLYGRVYRSETCTFPFFWSFLPIWEGVSLSKRNRLCRTTFPPYMGGCIVPLQFLLLLIRVSSLYGRVYRVNETAEVKIGRFLPIWEGVSCLQIIDYQGITFSPYMGGCIVAIDKSHFLR